jgi:hypothetical protein
MCGRYTLTIDKSTIEKHFGAKFYIAEPSYDWSPTYTAAPSHTAQTASSSRAGASGRRNGSEGKGFPPAPFTSTYNSRFVQSAPATLKTSGGVYAALTTPVTNATRLRFGTISLRSSICLGSKWCWREALGHASSSRPLVYTAPMASRGSCSCFGPRSLFFGSLC